MVVYNVWTCEDAGPTSVEDEHKLVIQRDVFSSLGLAVLQQQFKSGKCVNHIDNFTCKVKQTIVSEFTHLASIIVLSKTHVVKSETKISSKVYSKASKRSSRPD